MNSPDIVRSIALNNLPQKKVQEKLDKINGSSLSETAKSTMTTLLIRFAESNIPLDYWSLKMDKDFHGDNNLLTFFNDYTADIKKSYFDGRSVCLAGQYGTGKTLTLCSIIKAAVAKNYTCLYTTLSDIVAILTSAGFEDKYSARRELLMVDFLIIDEVDNRFYSQSDLSNELFSRSFEVILRTRLQNKLPILMATNSPNIKESFTSFFKDSLSSLMSKIEEVSVFGKDYRKKEL
jgi:DNA replication protein DnaC